MRITQNFMTRSYMRSLNRNIAQLASSNNKLSSQRKFNRVSEDPAAFARAFRIREQLQDNSDSINRVRDARNELAAADSNMMSISSIVSSAAENLLRAGTGTTSPEQREILAGELENLQREVLQLMNAKFGDRFLFSGSSNDKAPFEIKSTFDESGLNVLGLSDSLNVLSLSGKISLDAFNNNPAEVLVTVGGKSQNISLSTKGDSSVVPAIADGSAKAVYNNLLKSVKDKFGGNWSGTFDDVTGDFSLKNDDGKTFTMKHLGDKDETSLFYNGVDVNKATARNEFKEDHKVFLDIGLGLKIENEKPVPASGFQISTSGIDMLSFGTTNIHGKPVSNNICAMLGDAAKAVRSGDLSFITEVHDHMIEENKRLIISITDLGNRDKFLEYNEEKLSRDEIDLKAAQKELEAVSLEEESIYNKMYEMAWTATLQLGSKIIPPSIFDFMR